MNIFSTIIRNERRTFLDWIFALYFQLAVALDKVRNDHSLLVWDVESTPSECEMFSYKENPPLLSIISPQCQTTVSVYQFAIYVYALITKFILFSLLIYCMFLHYIIVIGLWFFAFA